MREVVICFERNREPFLCHCPRSPTQWASVGIGCVMNENPQGSLPFGQAFTPEQEFDKSMRPLKDAYEAASNIVVAGATGIDKSDLAKMFEPGSNRHLRYKAVFQIGLYASMELRRKALKPLARCWGLDICDPKPPPTTEVIAVTAVAVINSLGPIAIAALQAALDAPR